MPDPAPSSAGDPGRSRASDAHEADRARDRELVSALFAVLIRLPHVRIDEPVDKTGLAILHELTWSGTTRPSDLAAQMHIDISTVSRHLQALEAQLLVVRTRDPEDARAQRVDLTERGDEVLGRFLDGRSASLRAAISHWAAEDTAALRHQLGRLADDLAATSASTRPCAVGSTTRTHDTTETP